jgi:hypothetical protein
VSRDGLPRAYLRIDPNIDQAYPELRNTFVGLLCSAGRQPERGRYRDLRLVEGLHSRPFVRRSVERGDLTPLPDGRIYVVGWDEWQEGDMTVSERMRRMRERRKRNRVTAPASPDRNAVTTDAVAKGESSRGEGVGVGDFPPPPAERGRRKDRTNPRAEGRSPRQNGSSPRDLGTSPRQEREERKKGGLDSIAAILNRAAVEGRP